MNLILVEDITDIHDAAVASLKQHVFGIEVYPTLLHKGALLMRSLNCNQPFLDGNKRTSMLCALTFLELNDIVFITEEHQIEDIAVKIAVEKLNIEQISELLTENTVSTH